MYFAIWEHCVLTFDFCKKTSLLDLHVFISLFYLQAVVIFFLRNKSFNIA